MLNPDVIVIGSGAGGAVMAKELGEKGINVLVLEAGPWYGNKKWMNPNQEKGGVASSDPGDLDIALYKHLHNKLEDNMDNPFFGRFRWGPADRSRSPWLRNLPQNGVVMQASGVGGSTQFYAADSPRAFPLAVDNVWPISYKELIPYYEKVEQTLPVKFSAVTSKEELFYYGARKAGWPLLSSLNVESPGYRPQPNAILPPNENITNPQVSLKELAQMEGCSLSGHCLNGCTTGPSVDKIAKRSTDVSYIPLALKTGHVTVRPNVFATRILTEADPAQGIHAVGVQYRDTWTGEIGEVKARAVVMSAGPIETPRLWLNSELPANPWVGKGLTNHYFDWVTGVFPEKHLNDILGSPGVYPFVGPTSGARLDYPGLGSIQIVGFSPALFAMWTYGLSASGYNFMNRPEAGEPWSIRGRTIGPALKQLMAEYRQSLSLLILADDQPDRRNGVSLDPFVRDENGFVPVIHYAASISDCSRRDQLARIAADLMLKAGAKRIIRTDLPPGLMVHIHSTMRMGLVVDTSCEAIQLKRLFIADNSVFFNGLGGPNPALTNQALATRTAEKIAEKYFS